MCWFGNRFGSFGTFWEPKSLAVFGYQITKANSAMTGVPDSFFFGGSKAVEFIRNDSLDATGEHKFQS